MAVRSNRSATARMVRELRRREVITDANVALATLALTSASVLDDARAGDAKPYEVAQLARCHLGALEALLALPAPAVPDTVDQLLAEIMRPGPGASDDRA